MQLFYHLIQQYLVRIFTKSSEASLKAWLHLLILKIYNSRGTENRSLPWNKCIDHNSKPHYISHLAWTLSLFTINSPFELHRWKGMDYLQGTFIKHNYKKMKFCQRSWSGRTQNTTHLGCAMWFTTANFINHKKNLSASPRLHTSQLHVWWCWKISQSRQFNQ